MSIFQDHFPAASRLQVHNYKRIEVVATWDTVGSQFEMAYETAVYGNDEPALIRVGKMLYGIWAHDRARGWCGLNVYREAVVIEDEKMREDEAEFYRWDRITYERPILFVAAVLKVVEGI